MARPQATYPQDLVTPVAVAKELGINSVWVYNRIKTGRLKAYDGGKSKLVSRAEVEALAQKKTVRDPNAPRKAEREIALHGPRPRDLCTMDILELQLAAQKDWDRLHGIVRTKQVW